MEGENEDTTQSQDTQDLNADTGSQGDTGGEEPQDDGDGQKHPLEPGGKRFNQVYARMGQAERDLAVEREARIRLEGQLAGVMENNQTTTQTQTVDIKQNLRERYTAGELDQFEALEALADLKTDEKLTKERNNRQLTDAYQSQMSSAIKEVQGYMKIAPGLASGDHPRMADVKTAYSELVGEGYSADQRTERMALRQVFGGLETFKRRSNMGKNKGDHFSESGAGGGIETTNGGEKDPFSDISARHKQYWDDRGAPLKEREAEAKIIRAGKAKK